MTAPARAGNPYNEPWRASIIRRLLKLKLSTRWRLALEEALINTMYDYEESQDGADHGRIEGARIFELRNVEEEREAWLTHRLTREAHKLRVPVPALRYDSEKEDVAEPWERGSGTGEYYLSAKGYKELRDAIRDERKARREARAHMINWLAAWTGVLGALAAVISAYVGYVALTR